MAKRIEVMKTVLVRESCKNYHIESKTIRTPEDVYSVIKEVFDIENQPNEHFGILLLSTKNKINAAHMISVGNLNATVVHPREVFRPAILANTSAIVLFHNHPSGDPTPSQEDIQMTLRLVESGQIIGIDVLDHVIIGDGNFVSLKEQDLM